MMTLNKFIFMRYSSDSDSDESFYGPIESPVEIINASDDQEEGRVCD